MGETMLMAGTLNRYRCPRCGDWTSLVGVGVDPPRTHEDDTETNPHNGTSPPDLEELHLVFCVNCGRGMGETKLLPGALNRYHCRSCKEWMWFVGVVETSNGAQDGSNGN